MCSANARKWLKNVRILPSVAVFPFIRRIFEKNTSTWGETVGKTKEISRGFQFIRYAKVLVLAERDKEKKINNK